MNKCLGFSFDYSKQKEHTFGLFSDLHIDADGFNKKLFNRHAERVVNAGGRIYINGDTFDAILPQDKKRYTASMAKYQQDDQIMPRIAEAVEVLKPYVDHIDMIGVGNHETAILRYHGIDIVRMLVWELDKLRSKNLQQIKCGGYTWFIRQKYIHGDNRSTKTLDIWYNHGTGGTAPVTKGMIGMSRATNSYLADVYWMGHIHRNWANPGDVVIYPDAVGNIVTKKITCVYTGGYKSQVHEADANK